MSERNEQMNEQITETAASPKKPRGLNRKWRYGTASTVLTVVVIAAVVLLNVVANILEARFPVSLDLTANDTYTISDSCRAIAADTEADVEVIAFQTETYFSSPSLGNDDLNTIARQFYEAMKQCNIASGGRITTRYIDYADNPALVAKYADYDVDESSILFLSGERYGVTSLVNMFEYDQNTYMYYGQIKVTESLVEQQIATNLLKVTGDLAPVVVMTGHGEDSYALQNVKAVLENNAYEVIECDLTKSEEITDQAITMVIPAPETDYSNDEVVKIRDWLKQDGEYSRNLVMLTGYSADCQNLYELIEEEYGIEITQEMVNESKNYYTSPYYAYGDVAESDFTGDLNGEKVLSLFTRRLILHKDNDPELYLYNTPLVTFGQTAKLVDLSKVDKSAQESATEKSSDSKIETYAADVYPVVGSAFAHKQVPSPTTNTTVESYVVVFGSPYFLDTSILSYITTAKNEDLFLTVFNDISGSEAAATVSSRSVNTVYLAFEDAPAKVLGIGVFTVALPVAALAAGLIVFLKRRHL